MAPRGFINPTPKTESAREAAKSFYCELCSKGYSRMNEYEAHLSSYDHSHKQRLKDMKQMTRDPMASSKARKQEAKANSGLISIKLGGDGGEKKEVKGGFKKGGFKSAFRPIGDGDDSSDANKASKGGKALDGGDTLTGNLDSVESDTDDEGYEVYDPRYPTE